MFSPWVCVSSLAMFLVGMALASIYLAGLWWTVKRVTSRGQSPWWLAASFLLRVSVLMVGLYFVMACGVGYLLACLAGWIVARTLLVHIYGLQCIVPPKGDAV